MGRDGGRSGVGSGAAFLLLVVTSAGLVASTGCGRERPLPRRADAAARPNVLLVTLDTTRADRLGAYGHAPSPSPNLDRLADDAVVYSNAVATSSWTLPSHASLFTGKFPISHGARFDPDGPLFLSQAIEGPKGWNSYRARGLSAAEVTLAQLLREDGYATAAVVAGPWMKSIFGLGAGFDLYDDSLVDDVSGGRAEDVSDRALEFLRERGGERFFLFLNYYDPHSPYAPPLGFRIRLGPRFWFAPQEAHEAADASFYDAEIRYLDRHLGRLLDSLRELSLYDDTLIVVTSDHGELLGEHGKRGHGTYLTQEELHVPLIVKFPASEPAAGRRDELLSIAGVFALVLEQVGIEVPSHVQARIPPDSGAPVVAETSPLPAISEDGSWRALFEGRYKLLWNSEQGYRLHDLAADPSERVDFTPVVPDVADRLRVTLEAVFEQAPQPGDPGPARPIDPETQRALEGLGYLK